MIVNPIIERELLSVLRSRMALAMQVAPAIAFTLLVLLRWPSDALVDLSGAQAQFVFRLFGYGLLISLIFLVPAYPATSLVREKNQGTLALLLNTPMSSWSIYFGKLVGVLGFALLPLIMSLPAAAACYTMGGISLTRDVGALYLVLAVVTVQYTALGLYVSSFANSSDGALRLTYALTVGLAGATLLPYQFLQGKADDWLVVPAIWLRAVSPVPAVMEILGHGDLGAQGIVAKADNPYRYMITALIVTAYFALHTTLRLKQTMFDRPRPAGVITDDRAASERWFRRLFFVVDPQRRKGLIGSFTNPVMVKEFRCRRFGRLHWLLRGVALIMVLSFGLVFASSTATIDWGVATIGSLMVIVQVVLIVLLTPSLASGLISGEVESGGWTLLLMTPLSAGRILRGKLLSAVWTLVLILFATLPGYVVMIYFEPGLQRQVKDVLVSILLMEAFALMLSAAVSSLCGRTAPATIISYTCSWCCAAAYAHLVRPGRHVRSMARSKRC